MGLLDVVIRLRRTGMPVDQVRAFVDRVRADHDIAGRIRLLIEHRTRRRTHHRAARRLPERR